MNLISRFLLTNIVTYVSYHAQVTLMKVLISAQILSILNIWDNCLSSKQILKKLPHKQSGTSKLQLHMILMIRIFHHSLSLRRMSPVTLLESYFSLVLFWMTFSYLNRLILI